MVMSFEWRNKSLKSHNMIAHSTLVNNEYEGILLSTHSQGHPSALHTNNTLPLIDRACSVIRHHHQHKPTHGLYATLNYTHTTTTHSQSWATPLLWAFNKRLHAPLNHSRPTRHSSLRPITYERLLALFTATSNTTRMLYSSQEPTVYPV